MKTKPTTQQIVNALKGKNFQQSIETIETKFNGKRVATGVDQAIARFEVNGVNFYTVNFFNYDKMGKPAPAPTFNFL